MPSKRPSARLAVLPEADLNDAQKTLLAALRSGPRGNSLALRGPFAAWMHAPEFGLLAQALGAHCRYNTTLPPRLSEFAILCTARLWRAQFEWYAHEPMALKGGVKPKTIADLRAGREPKSAPKDERAIYAFVQELYKNSPRQRPHLQAGERAHRRPRHCRTRWYLRLLRADLDDAQRLPHAAARGREAGVPGAVGEVAPHDPRQITE